MPNYFTFNGSNIDFGSLVTMDDWLKKQQSATGIRPFEDRINEQVANETGITGFKLEAKKFFNDTKSEFAKKGKFILNDSLFGSTGQAVGGGLNKFASSGVGSAVSAGLDIASSFIKNRPEYKGKYGSITKGMDAGYDAAMKAVGAIPGWGQAAQLIMGAGKLANKAVGRLGGGTDGMTKTDALLGSNFLGLTPLGLINGFGGKKANTYTRNLELDTATNGGYQGFLTTQDYTQIGAGKKYGAFSSGARHKQNQLTEFTQNMKHTVSGVVDTNTINNLAAQGSTPFIAQQQSIDLSGGVQLMRAARLGMKLTPRYGLGSFFRKLFPSQKAKDKLWHSVINSNVTDGYHTPIGQTSEFNNKQYDYQLNTNEDSFFLLDENRKPRINYDGSKVINPNYKEWNRSFTTNYAIQKGLQLDKDGYVIPNLPSADLGQMYQSIYNQPIDGHTWDQNTIGNRVGNRFKLKDVTTNPKVTTNRDYISFTNDVIRRANDIYLNEWLEKNKPKPIPIPYKQGGQLNYKRVVSKYQMGNKLRRSIKVLDVADHTYVDIPLNLTLDLIKGREPIRLPGNKIVFMNGDGTVTSDRWETIGLREHLTPRGLGGIKMSYNDWYNGLRKKGVANINYDYKRAYETLPYEELIAHYNNPNKNHLHSVALLPNGDYIFLKLGKRGSEVDKELAAYNNGKTGLEDTHDLKFNEFENRYYIRKKGPNAKQGEFSKNGNIVSEFKKGGQMNVIPEGALHARLNHLNLVSEDLSKITPKGIPVITKEEGGEVVLHAEIEHSEIIFTLDVTNKIEDLRKKWHEDKKDEYAIEAGKILVKEILHNTDDRTNLIKSIE